MIEAADSLINSMQETDPIFYESVARGINSADTMCWNNKLDSIAENQDLHDKPISIFF